MKKLMTIIFCMILFTTGCDFDEFEDLDSLDGGVKTTLKNEKESTTITEVPTTTTTTTTRRTTTTTTTARRTTTTTQAVENERLPLKAICKDGTVSYQDDPSKPDYRGMCSHHGGIRTKLGRVK